MEPLKETYGYDGFRNLEIYDDLFKTGILCISQGQLVENVIRKRKKAEKGEQYDNILLTVSNRCGKVSCSSFPPSIWEKNITC